MTQSELLTEALKHFTVMYLDAPRQQAILKQAVGKYRDMVGPSKVVKVATDTATFITEVAKPADFLSVAICLDAEGRWHDVTVTDTALSVDTTVYSISPFKIHYFIDLSDVPKECEYLLSSYLHCLLDIPNTARAREVMNTTGLQIELPGESELDQRRVTLEQEMEESQAIIPMATVY